MGSDRHMWLREKLSRITPEETSGLAKMCNETNYEKGGWTALKLISLMLYTSMYTTILKKYKIFKKIIYMDAFAGPGIVSVEVGGKKYRVLGSSLLVPLLYERSFDKMYFFDTNKKYMDCLEVRLKEGVENFSDKKYILRTRDANKELIDVLKTMGKNDHYLAFIDPEGMEVNWSTMEELLNHRGDIIFNFTTGINRVSEAGQIEKMNKFFGCEEWKGLKTHEEFVDLYIKRITSISKRVVMTADIKRTRNEKKYTLLFVAPKTGGENPWLKNIVNHLNERIAKNYEKEVNNILAILNGDQKMLDDFLNPGMRTLDDFLD